MGKIKWANFENTDTVLVPSWFEHHVVAASGQTLLSQVRSPNCRYL